MKFWWKIVSKSAQNRYSIELFLGIERESEGERRKKEERGVTVNSSGAGPFRRGDGRKPFRCRRGRKAAARGRQACRWTGGLGDTTGRRRRGRQDLLGFAVADRPWSASRWPRPYYFLEKPRFTYYLWKLIKKSYYLKK
jgi:hypothetical protein